MRKNTRKTLVGMATVTAAALAMAAMPATASAEDAGTTPASYEQYLVTQVELGDTDAQETLSQYQELSDGEKEQFITYLNDPERGQELGDFLSDTTVDLDSIDEETYETQLRKETEGGDVVLEAEIDVEETETAPTTDEELSDPSARYYDRSAWYSVTDKILGVRVTTVKIGVNYRTTSKRVTKVYNGWASHTNRVPFLEYEHSPVKKWISADPANNAHAETIWQGKWKGISWNGRQRVWADQTGFKGGYLKRDN